jgi:surface protein
MLCLVEQILLITIAVWERTGSTIGNVNNMGDMFSSGNRSFFLLNQPIGNWNVSNVTSMANLFFTDHLKWRTKTHKVITDNFLFVTVGLRSVKI